METQKIIKAGKLAKEVREYIKPKIKKSMPLLEIAELIEKKIVELGGKPAFPTNLSINEIAAHYTPSYDDKTLAHGLIKVDFGVHIDGWCSDQAFSLDLENSEINKKLIQSSEEALKSAIEKINKNALISEIGRSIQKEISSFGYNPIVNLSGHEIGEYDLHAGLTIPNIDNKSANKILKGLYAIEPFSTNGVGKIQDKNPSGIYQLIDTKTPRTPLAREVLEYLAEEYRTLPFCSRWLVNEFGTKAILALKQLEQNGNINQYNQLVEISKGIVAQSEHTVLIDEKGNKTVTTL